MSRSTIQCQTYRIKTAAVAVAVAVAVVQVVSVLACEAEL
jgi:hypothetical protein